VGYDDARTDQRYIHPYGYVTDRLGSYRKQDWDSRTLSTDYVASQQVSLSSALKTTISVGGQLVQTNRDSILLIGAELPGPAPATVSSANSVTTAVAQSQVITGGFLGQAMIAFKDRYFITAGARVDGNSAFGTNLGLQTYPKASASYVVSEEPFWPQLLGTMKLRGAYGWAGRAPGAFDASYTWNSQVFAGGGGAAIIPRNPGNPDLAPERSQELEVGFDNSSLHDHLAIEFSYYNRVTNDALLRVSYPPSLGNVNQQFENVGKFTNHGIELSATGKIIDKANFGFELNATLATNKSKVITVGKATVYNVQPNQPAPVVRTALKVVNGDNFEDPVACTDLNNPGSDGHACVLADGFFGPNLPTRTVTLAPTFRLPKQISVTARAEWQAGAFYTQGANHFLAQRGPYGTPPCDEVYRYVPWSEYDGPAYYASSVKRTHANLSHVSAVDRMRCYKSVPTTDLFTWAADFIKMRELTVQAPVPFRIPRLNSAMITLSARNFWTRKLNGNRSSDPEVGGNATVDGLTFGVSDAIPAPAEFTVSLRATF
jgi:outer membrane receptor protein involved in Fe transport